MTIKKWMNKVSIKWGQNKGLNVALLWVEYLLV